MNELKYANHQHRLLEELHAKCKQHDIEPADIRNTAKGPTKDKVALTRKVGAVHYELTKKSTLYSPTFQAEAFGISVGLINTRIYNYINSQKWKK